MLEFLQQVLFQIGDWTFTVRQIFGVLCLLAITFILYRLIVINLFSKYLERRQFSSESSYKVRRILAIILFLVCLFVINKGLKLDYFGLRTDIIAVNIGNILIAMIIFQVAKLLDWFFKNVLLNSYSEADKEETASLGSNDLHPPEDFDGSAGKMMQWVLALLGSILIIRTFQIDFEIFNFEHYNFKISNIIWAALILVVARLLSWILTRLFLFSYFKKNRVNVGSQFAVSRLLTYVIYVIAFLFALESLGIQMTVIWGAMAALLVGVGFGLQQTFNDLFSGIILLFERTVEVGDVVDIDGMVGPVKRIGLRSSIVETRENITVVVPNSKFVVNKVVNWNHVDDRVRFMVKIGVAYGTDTEIVKQILLEIAKENIYILKLPAPFVRFVEFGSSSLDFELHFWSRNIIVIEDIKSDLRFEIDKKFREQDITIPFPQLDVWKRT